MTKERRQDLVVLAIVVSVALHVGLMFYVRAKVMTHVANDGLRNAKHDVMRIRDYTPPDDPVRMERIKDIMAVKDAPKAEAEEALLPSTEQLPDDAKQHFDDKALAPEAPSAAEVQNLAETPAEFDATPLEFAKTAPDPLPTVEFAVPAGQTLTAPEALAGPDLKMPAAFGAPEVKVDVPVLGGDLAGRERMSSFARAKVSFTPSVEVFKEVDEKIVEAEKAAVRELMSEDETAALEPFVNMATVKAEDAGWTYFKMMVTPRTSLAVVPKDVVILLDASGSIGSDRLVSCRLAAKGILRSALNTGDRFNLVAFRNSFSYAFRSWQECNTVSFNAADKWLSNLTAHGRTDVFSTIRSVLTLPRDPTRPLIALVVTDGDANAGVSDTAQILSKFTDLNDGLVSVYMYGVRSSANRELIDVLTHGNRGESFIHGGSRWKAGDGIDSLSTRFRDPVLSDLRLVFTTESRVTAYPRLLKNLYRGDTIEVTGRVPRGVNEVAFSLKGLHGSEAYEGFF